MEETVAEPGWAAQLRGEDSNLRLPVQSRASLPLDYPAGTVIPLPRPNAGGGGRASIGRGYRLTVRPIREHVFYGRER